LQFANLNQALGEIWDKVVHQVLPNRLTLLIKLFLVLFSDTSHLRFGVLLLLFS
jgi:hypothetical protein